MFGVRRRLCYEISKRLIEPPTERTSTGDGYLDWRTESLRRSWSQFDDELVRGKHVLDFGCGAGSLSLFLAGRGAERVVGVDLTEELIEIARKQACEHPPPEGVGLEFMVGAPSRVPVPDASFDTLCAFDCVEHIMDPAPIFADWARVLRPGGRALIEWFPYLGPWGPHMEALVPIPWAHVLFGERAMFRTCERIYDDPNYVHRSWDFDEGGQLKSNKWRQWSSFREQGYVNQLRVSEFRNMVDAAGFEVTRLEPHTFGSLPAKALLEPVITNVPLIGELMTSWVIVVLTRR